MILRGHSALLVGGVAILAAIAPMAHAGNIDLFDFALSTNTGVSGDWEDVTTADPTLIIDSSSSIYNDTNCCGDASGGTTQGLGTLSYTFNPGPGSYVISLYFDYDASTPFFNEFGTINNGASAQSGISYEIFNAGSTTSNIVLFPANGTPGGEKYGTANGTNLVPGTTDNFLNTCTNKAVCNSDVGMALTYSFSLSAGQFAVLTAAASTTNPGGFSLETTHPVDANNNSATSVFLTGSYAIETGCTVNCGVTPEPSTWILMGLALASVGAACSFGRKARV